MNLASIIDAHPAERVALRAHGRPVTYGGLRAHVDELRAGLAALGIGPGDRVGLMLTNDVPFVVTYLAVLGLGAVAVPLNPTSPPPEVARELDHVEAAALVVGPATAGVAGATGFPRDRVLLAAGAELEGATPLERSPGATSVPVAAREPGDLAVLVFTAGTSGSPKAAMLTHGNLRSNLDQLQAHPERALRPDDVLLGVLPLFHIFGLNVVLGLALHVGAEVALLERFEPGPALAAVQEHRVTVVAGAPPMFQAWLALPAEAGAAASLRLAASGAAALPREVAEGFEQRFGVPLLEGYGLTEAGPAVTSALAGERSRPGSIGVPLPGVEVRLVDVEGEDALEGDEGEIWVRGPNVFAGYWRDERATAAVLTGDGWLRTGDVAVADEDGYLYLVDRAKDLVIVSGFNVYPAEVEEVLLEHPSVAEVAVVGAAHPHTGETVEAFVVPAAGRTLDPADVVEFCASRLARYKCPTRVTSVPELPHGLGGKLLRRELRG